MKHFMNKDQLRICFDLDGTICTSRQDPETYHDVKLIPGAKEMIDSLKAEGHCIIINTSRNMQTQGHNVGKVIKNIGKITLDWLEKYEIYYDEIYFGKPNAHITIDDRCVRFNKWENFSKEEIIKLAKHK